MGLMAQNANARVPEVYLMISTPGGEVMAGLNLYNVLRAMPFKLITHKVGNVDSIGNAVFLAGEERYACPHATFMFHGVGFNFPGQFRLEEKDLRERLNSVLSDQQRSGAIMSERTQIRSEDIEPLFREAAETCIQHQLGSTSLLQRKLRIGYGRAARIIDQLQDSGILGPPDGSKPREVLIGMHQVDEYCR